MNPIGPKKSNDPKPQPKFVEVSENLDKDKKVSRHDANFWLEEDVQKDDDFPSGLYDPISKNRAALYLGNEAIAGMCNVQAQIAANNKDNKGINYKEIDLDTFLDNRDSKEALNFKKLATKEDLSGADLSDMNISNFDFSGANLAKAEIIDSTFTNVDFSNCDLSNAHLENVTFIDCKIDGLDLSNAKLESLTLDGMKVRAIKLSGTTVFQLTIKDSKIYDDFEIADDAPASIGENAFKVLGDSKLISSKTDEVLFEGQALQKALDKAFAGA